MQIRYKLSIENYLTVKLHFHYFIKLDLNCENITLVWIPHHRSSFEVNKKCKRNELETVWRVKWTKWIRNSLKSALENLVTKQPVTHRKLAVDPLFVWVSGCMNKIYEQRNNVDKKIDIFFFVKKKKNVSSLPCINLEKIWSNADWR